MSLLTDILTQSQQAATDAATNSSDAQTKANDARKSALLAHDDAGQAQGLFAALTSLNLANLLGNIPTPQQMATATSQRDAAVQSAADADNAINNAEPKVIVDHDACLLSTFIAPLVACVTLGSQNATNATTNVAPPAIIGGASDRLDAIVQKMISKAATMNPTLDDGCNAGVQILADAAKLITDQTDAAQLGKLQDCIDELNAAAPADPNIAAGNAAKAAAQQLIEGAHNLLFDQTNPDILHTWRKRIVCTIPQLSFHVQVIDESDDGFGDTNADSVSVNVVNVPFNVLPELPLPVGLGDSDGNMNIQIPLAPTPLPLPTGTPPVPSTLPTSQVAALNFTATHPSTNNKGLATLAVDHTGVINGGATITIKIPDASSPTS